MIDFSQLALAIDAERVGSAVLIRPRIDNPTPLTLDYRLTVTQVSNGYNSRINQGGEITTGSVPSTVRITLQAGGSCQAHLEVFQAQTLIKSLDRNCDEA